MITIEISHKTGMVFIIDVPIEAVEDTLPCMLDSVHNIVFFDTRRVRYD